MIAVCVFVCRLTIHDSKAKLSFFREFILRLDGCSDMMEGVFRNCSTDSSICSIITNPRCSSSLSRSSTSLSLPRIVQPVMVHILWQILKWTYSLGIVCQSVFPKYERFGPLVAMFEPIHYNFYLILST